jgi:hypothetical protein
MGVPFLGSIDHIGDQEMKLNGPVLRTFETSKIVLGTLLIVSLTIGLGIIGVAAKNSDIAIAAFAVLPFAASAYVLYYACCKWRSQILVYEDGICIVESVRQLDTIEDVSWRDVKYVTEQQVTFLMIVLHWYDVHLRDGRKYTFDSIWNRVPELGDIIQTETRNALLPTTIKSINAGELVCFGEISLSVNGLHHCGEVLQWGDFDGIVFDGEGNIIVAQRCQYSHYLLAIPDARWCKIKMKNLWNPYVFFAIIDLLQLEAES